MKKYILIPAAALALAAAAGLTACGGDGGDPAIHSIACTESELYRVIDLAETGQTGSTILFDVRSESVFYEIGEVSCNGTALTKESLGYKFTMPDEDVTIQVALTPVTEYDDPDDYLSWGGSVIDEISAASAEDLEVSWDVTHELALSFDMAKFGSYNSVIEKRQVLSSDQDVIPDEALHFEEILDSDIHQNGTNSVVGGNIVIDRKQINPGTVTLYVSLDFNNASAATLMRTFTVTEYGTIEVETQDVAFAVTNDTKFEDAENIRITFTDTDYIYGSPALRSQTFTLSELSGGTGTLEYTVGHTYSVSASHAVWNADEGKYESVTALTIEDWVGQGSSDTAFNQIIDGELTLTGILSGPVPIRLTD